MIKYPKSFPNQDEEEFLDLVLASKEDFGARLEKWKNHTNLEYLDYSISRLLPLLYLRLSEERVEDSMLPVLRGIYKSTWAKNQRLLHVLESIAIECYKEKIPLLLLKGIPLLLNIYQDIGARYVGDADILVPVSLGMQMTDLMLKMGFEFDKPWSPEVQNKCESIFYTTKSTTFKDKSGVKIDVHWNVFDITFHTSLLKVILLKPLPSINLLKDYWENAIETNLSNVPCLRLSDEDMLIHIIVHGSEGNDNRTLRFIVDAIYLIRDKEIDWSVIINRAKKNFSTSLYIGFSYLKEKFNSDIPDTVIEELKSIPKSRADFDMYYYTSNIAHSKRFYPLGNLPNIWYAYWQFEKGKKSILGFIHYARQSWGLRSARDIAIFAYKKLRLRLTNLNKI